ncbi:MAG: hypothetical protein IJ859_01695 [Synergistaceae bacterium]|nr:hypothetical protein [Synergistaceae bacterium]
MKKFIEKHPTRRDGLSRSKRHRVIGGKNFEVKVAGKAFKGKTEALTR